MSLRSYLFYEQRGKCHYCNVPMTLKTSGKYFCTKDHKVPKSMGGSDMVLNLVGACNTCNNMRGTIPYWAFKQFIQLYGNSRKVNQVLRSLTREEYEKHKRMWDAIHEYKSYDHTVPYEPAPLPVMPSYRRPFLSDARIAVHHIVKSFGIKERNYIYLMHEKKGKTNEQTEFQASG